VRLFTNTLIGHEAHVGFIIKRVKTLHKGVVFLFNPIGQQSQHCSFIELKRWFTVLLGKRMSDGNWPQNVKVNLGALSFSRSHETCLSRIRLPHPCSP